MDSDVDRRARAGGPAPRRVAAGPAIDRSRSIVEAVRDSVAVAMATAAESRLLIENGRRLVGDDDG